MCRGDRECPVRARDSLGARAQVHGVEQVAHVAAGLAVTVDGHVQERLPHVFGPQHDVEPPGVVDDGRDAALEHLAARVLPAERLVDGPLELRLLDRQVGHRERAAGGHEGRQGAGRRVEEFAAQVQ